MFRLNSKLQQPPVNYSCCLTRKQSLWVCKDASLALQTLSQRGQPCDGQSGWETAEEPQTAPGCRLSIPTGDTAAPRPLPHKSRRCTVLSSPNFPPRGATILPPPPSTGVIPAARDLARTQSQSKQWTKYSGGWPGCSCRMHLPRPPR